MTNMQLARFAAQWDPYCPVDWQWRLAQRIASDEPTTRLAALEPQISAAVAMLKRNMGRRVRRAVPLESNVVEALDIHRADSDRTWELEALLLCRLSDEEIAVRTGIAAATISVYEQLFYCVREFRNARDWLLDQVVGEATFRGFCDEEVRQFWSFLAISGGAVIVEHFVHLYRRVRSPDEPPRLSIYLRDGEEIPLPIQAHVAEKVLPSFAERGSELSMLWSLVAENCAVDSRDDPTGNKIKDELLGQTLVDAARAYLAEDRQQMRRVIDRLKRESLGFERRKVAPTDSAAVEVETIAESALDLVDERQS